MSDRFSVIYADPPWHFATYSAKGRGRCADAHYDVLSFADLQRIPVHDFARHDCALFLWTTDPLLPKGIELMESWGFKFKTVAFHWAKLKKSSAEDYFTSDSFFVGLGYWTRANSEICLLGTRGNPKRKSRSVRRLILSPRREHSRKPDEIYDRIEELIDGPYLEMFARNTRRNWSSWGKEVGLFDGGSVPTRRYPSSGPRGSLDAAD